MSATLEAEKPMNVQNQRRLVSAIGPSLKGGFPWGKTTRMYAGTSALIVRTSTRKRIITTGRAANQIQNGYAACPESEQVAKNLTKKKIPS
mmetsp:Transcript_138954/g.252627  ORF Transcript_138954/g.252627 Transcript_138954/m.252627 type:complete len:91 (+) Transcript_138954:574-846(+)